MPLNVETSGPVTEKQNDPTIRRPSSLDGSSFEFKSVPPPSPAARPTDTPQTEEPPRRLRVQIWYSPWLLRELTVTNDEGHQVWEWVDAAVRRSERREPVQGLLGVRHGLAITYNGPVPFHSAREPGPTTTVAEMLDELLAHARDANGLVSRDIARRVEGDPAHAYSLVLEVAELGTELDRLTSAVKGYEDREVQERERKAPAKQIAEPFDLRKESLSSRRSNATESVTDLRGLVKHLSQEELFLVASEALARLTQFPKTPQPPTRFRDARDAIEAVQEFRTRVAAAVVLPIIETTVDPREKRRQKNNLDALTKEFGTLIAQLEGLQTEDTAEKRTIAKTITWLKSKLKLETLWTDQKPCAVGGEAGGGNGYWRLTRGRQALTRVIGFPKLTIRPRSSG